MSAVLPSRDMPIGWRAALSMLLLAVVAVLLLYRETFAAMVGIWYRSDTFAHAFLVPPISLWLIWRRREELRTLAPAGDMRFVAPMLVAALAWLLGDMAGSNALTQLAATTLLVLTVPVVLGATVASAILFPLCFLLFMVPVGEFVMPQLMQWTADVTVFLLRAFGIPVYREGLQFVIPSGSWSVVEACSGVRYLIASFMVGTLFAYLNYHSTRRRVLFAVVSLLVPVVANWARAVMIVLLGHFSGNKIAVGADHLIYGWVFFGFVVMLMFFIGARWSEPQPATARTDGSPTASVRPDAGGRGASWMECAALLVVLALPHAIAWSFATAPERIPQLVMPTLQLPEAQLTERAQILAPVFDGARAQASRVYLQGARAVTVHVAYYRQQTYGHKLVDSQNVLVKSDDRNWHRTSAGEKSIVAGGRSVPVRTAVLRPGHVGADPSFGRRLEVRQVFWVGGRLTTKDHMAVFYGILDKLTGRGDDAAAITFYMSDDGADASGATLDAFVASQLDPIAAWLRSVQAAP